jgi:glycosyltransferase involved in cell wall biosynthesis
MRVAFVSMHTHHTRDTHVNRRLSALAGRLSNRGHEVTVLCGRWWDGSHPTFEQDGITYRVVDGSYSSRLFVSKLPFALRRTKPDLVHVPNSPVGHARAAKTACKLLRVPLVADWWSDKTGEAASDYRKLARSADALIAPSETVKTVVRGHGGPNESISVIPESIDFSLIESAPVDDRVDYVYSRRLDDHANVETFLLALAELRTREWRAAVIGTGPALRGAKRTARDLRIRDRVAFVGDLSPEKRVAVLKGAHVFAQTATHEPFATDLLWGLASGCVGISEYQVDSAAHELIEDKSKLPDTRGSLVSTPQELADEIIAAENLDHQTLNSHYKQYDHRPVVDQYVECYQDAVDAYGFF